MAKIKIILVTAILGLSLASLVLFYKGGRAAYNPAELIDALPQNVDMQLSGVNFTEVTEGKREWNLKAATMHYYKSTDTMVFDQVEATFYTEEGVMTVTGQKGYYDKKAQKVRLMGRVRAKDSKGYFLSTNEIHYDVSTRVLHVPGSFRLTGPTMILAGQGLKLFTEERRLKVLSQADVLVKSTGNLL